MVELEMDGFTLNVPLKPRMHIKEFVEAVEKVEHLARADERAHAHAAPSAALPSLADEPAHTHAPARSVAAAPPAATPSVAPIVFASTAAPTPAEPRVVYVQAPPSTPAPLAPAPIRTRATPEDFQLPHEDRVRVQHLSNQVRSHVEHIKRHEDVLASHEDHLREILQYLQSLDKYIRKR